MNIYSDKMVYKLIAVILGVFSILALALASIAGGLKAVLFTVWIILAVFIFWAVIVFCVTQKGLLSSSPKILTRVLWGFADFHVFRFLVGLFAILLAILTYSVWTYLDSHLPSKERNDMLVSAIPAPSEE